MSPMIMEKIKIKTTPKKIVSAHFVAVKPQYKTMISNKKLRGYTPPSSQSIRGLDL